MDRNFASLPVSQQVESVKYWALNQAWQLEPEYIEQIASVCAYRESLSEQALAWSVAAGLVEKLMAQGDNRWLKDENLPQVNANDSVAVAESKMYFLLNAYPLKNKITPKDKRLECLTDVASRVLILAAKVNTPLSHKVVAVAFSGWVQRLSVYAPEQVVVSQKIFEALAFLDAEHCKKDRAVAKTAQEILKKYLKGLPSGVHQRLAVRLGKSSVDSAFCKDTGGVLKHAQECLRLAIPNYQEVL